MMSVKHVLDRLRRNLLSVAYRQSGAAREVSIDDDEIILHLDNDVIAVARILYFALTEPHAGSNLLDRTRLGVGDLQPVKTDPEQNSKSKKGVASTVTHADI